MTNSIINKKDINRYKFKLTHKLIIKNNDLIKFKKLKESKKLPSIYIWLQPLENDNYKILYVGKAGRGVDVRFSQHERGVIESTTGKKNAKLIREVLNEDNIIEIYSKTSDTICFFDQKIYAYSSEEEAFAAAYSPLWNRTNFLSFHETKKEIKRKSTHVDTSSLTNKEIFENYINSPNFEVKKKFLEILKKIKSLPSKNFDFTEKIVGGYSNQLSGYNNIPMVVYAKVHIGTNLAKANEWFFRVPMIEKNKDLTVFLNQKKINLNLNKDMLIFGKKNICRPKNLNHFLVNINKYMRLNDRFI